MKGVETVNGKTRHYYQYKPNGPKFYYTKRVTTVQIPFRQQAPPRPKTTWMPEKRYQPPPPLHPIDRVFCTLPQEAQTLVNTWLLIFGFQTVRDMTKEAVDKAFRRQSLIHHPDRGGSEDKYKELGRVREHLLTILALAGA